MDGVDGEPVAVALLASGVRTLSRSFRFHRPRGLMCSTGQCGWCECAVDGRPSVRTCEVPVRAGLDVRGEHAWPRVGTDLFELLGVGSRFVPPTFYHHRFLRPKALRKRYLDVIRAFGGRGRLRPGRRSPAAAAAGRVLRTDAPDVLVIGAGRAGLLAAMAAAETAPRVVVLERRDAGADGVLMDAARSAAVEVWIGTTATGWYDGLVTALGPSSAWELRPRTVIAAAGSYELMPTVPGADRPGVMGARRVRELVDRHRVLPGDRALCVGEGPELEGARVALIGAGATVVGRVPTERLVRIGGRRAVAWADHLDEDGRRQRVSVDVVVVGDRTPNIDPVLAAGAAVAWREDGRLAPATDAEGSTSVPGLWAVTSEAGEDACRAAGRAAAAAATAATAAMRGSPAAAAGTPGDRVTRRPGDPHRPSTVATHAPPPAHAHDDAVLCFCEDVRAWEIRAEQRHGYTDPELVKRRTGALTGPCQGKYCLAAVSCAIATAHPGTVIDLPTGRPPLVPTRLGDLMAATVAPTGADDDPPAGR